MADEKEIVRKLEQYRELAKENKNIDVAALTASTFEQERRDEIDVGKKRWAYLISAGLPPFGLLIALRYYFSGKTDGKRVALICVILTVAAGLIGWVLAAAMFSSLGTSPSQFQDVKMEDLKSLLQ